MNNYERIKQMSVDEMAEFIIYSDCHCIFDGSDCKEKDCKVGTYEWLLTECE